MRQVFHAKKDRVNDSILGQLGIVVGAVRLMTAVCQEDKEKEVLFCYGSKASKSGGVSSSQENIVQTDHGDDIYGQKYGNKLLHTPLLSLCDN